MKSEEMMSHFSKLLDELEVEDQRRQNRLDIENTHRRIIDGGRRTRLMVKSLIASAEHLAQDARERAERDAVEQRDRDRATAVALWNQSNERLNRAIAERRIDTVEVAKWEARLADIARRMVEAAI
jgi:hypothetical protein